MRLIKIVAATIVAAVIFAACYWMGYRRGTAAVHHSRTIDASPLGQSSAVPEINGPSRSDVLQMLPRKTWYWHWEKKDRERPAQFTIGDDGQISRGSRPWKLELRWVLNEGDHFFLPINERTITGFYVPTGRQTGLFSDEP